MLNTLGVKAAVFSLTKHNVESIAVATCFTGVSAGLQHCDGVRRVKETHARSSHFPRGNGGN